MANVFKNGDIVVLKSGGVPMTIDASPGEATRTTYLCVWQKGATHQQHGYSEQVLEKYVKPAAK